MKPDKFEDTSMRENRLSCAVCEANVPANGVASNSATNLGRKY